MPNNAPDLAQLLGVPVTITSGYRDPQHNALVGGVPHSDHLTDNARDFVPQGMSMADATAKLKQAGYSKTLNEGNHVHVSYAQGSQVPGISDDDLMKALTGGQPSAHAVAAHGDPQSISDDQLLKALTTGGTETPAHVASAAPPAAGKPKNPMAAMPFGFMEDLTSKLPFAKDAMAAGASGLDMAGAVIDGKPVPGFSQSYQQHMGELQAQQAQYEGQNPTLSGVATGGSVLAAGAPAKGLAIAKAGLPVLMKQGAKAGATLGALFGAGTPDQGNTASGRLGNAATGAILGGVTGTAAPIAGAGLAAGGRLVGGVANKLFPPAENIAAQRAKGIIENFAGGPVQPNASELVPGSKPTLAEATGNPGVAALTRAMRDLNPNSPLLAREAGNQEARLAHLETATGTPEDVTAAANLRDKAATSTLKSVFGAKTPSVDTAPVRQEISDILSGPSGARSSIKQAMKDVTDTLNNSGKPVTDPEALYQSVRKEIGDLISGTDMTKAYGIAAASQLRAVRDKLDDVIESGAPGFKKYLEDYTASSQPIASMKFLQEQNLLDAKGNITLQKVQTALKRLQTQQAAPGAKAAKSVTDAQQTALESIRDDLLRSKNIELGKAIGSNTVQNSMAQQRLGLSQYIPEGLGATAGAGLGGLVAGPHGAELGGMIGDRLGAMVGGARATRNAQAQSLLQSKLEEMLLNPSAYQAPPFASRSQASLNDMLNSPKAKALFAGANRLVATPQLRQKQSAR